MLIKAIFKGQNGSCNYITNKEYELVISHIIGVDDKMYITIKTIEDTGHYTYVEYESIISFLSNWDCICRFKL